MSRPYTPGNSGEAAPSGVGASEEARVASRAARILAVLMVALGFTFAALTVRVSSTVLGAVDPALRATFDSEVTFLASSVGLMLLACISLLAFHLVPALRQTERALANLERRAEVAELNDRAKANVLSNVSHEVRTPMNAIVGMAELLLKSELADRPRRYAQSILRSTHALLIVLNDLLELAQLDQGRLELAPRETDLEALILASADPFAGAARDKGLELVVTFHPALPERVRCDADRLRQVLTNLIAHSLKVTDAGEIVLSAAPAESTGTDARLRLELHDTGPSIPSSARASLFRPIPSQEVVGGSGRAAGAGLAICERIVSAMGGEIGLHADKKVGGGFWIELPVDVLRGAGPTASPFGPLRAVVVDTNVAARGHVARLLERYGMHVTELASASEAIRHVRANEADLGVVDARLREGEHDLSSALRALPGRRALPMILLTSSEASESGAVAGLGIALVAKPVRSSALHDAVSRALAAAPHDPKAASTRSADEPLALAGTRVLVAEDDPVNRDVLVEMLGDLGCTVDVVENGRDAVEATFRAKYDIVLMDCQMPEMDGYQAARAIREREAPGTHVRVVAVTAHAVIGERTRALHSGMDDYVTKPVSQRVLADAILRNVRTATPSIAPSIESSPPLSDPSSSTLDPDVRRSGRVVALFLEHVPPLLEEIRAALASGNTPRQRAMAHKLKGSCLAIGAPRMATLCRQLELPSPSSEGELTQLRAEFTRVAVVLRARATANP